MLIVDDVRAGFRLHLGGSHDAFGFEPDICCFGKAIANGYPLSAMVGTEAFRISAASVFYTGSYWFSAVPMAASLATLRLLEQENGVSKMREMGERLMSGLREVAQAHGQEIVCSGPPAIPFMTFAGETDFKRSQHFSREAMRRGVFFHPHHNWFLSTAHEIKDIDQAINVADESFASVKKAFGTNAEPA